VIANDNQQAGARLMLRLRLKLWLNSVYGSRIFVPLRRALMWLALGPHTYGYMRRSLGWDPRLRNARMVDIVVRKDAVEKRFEADWLKRIARVVLP
jgi:hypothetical protein